MQSNNKVQQQIDWDVELADIRNHETFDAAFRADAKAATGSVFIKSGYLSGHRVEYLADVFLDLKERGVLVHVFAQQPRDWERRHEIASPRIAATQSGIRMLQALGVHVTLRKNIHEKICVLDGCTLYRGSLNTTSFYDTEEEMVRTVNPLEALHTIYIHKLDHCEECFMNSDNGSGKRRHCGLADIGTQIAELREVAKLTQDELATKAGVGRNSIGRLEKGLDVSNAVLQKVCAYFGLSVWIVPDSGDRYLTQINNIFANALTRSK